MMMKAAGAGGGMIHALHISERKPLPKWVWFAIGGSILLHVGGAAWLYQQKVKEMSGPATIASDPPITIFQPPIPKPTKPVQVRNVVPVHQTKDVVPDVIDKSPIAAQPKASGDTTDATIATQTVETVVDPGPAEPVKERGPRQITKPQWVSRPTADQMARYYPPAAVERGIEGKVVMSCSVTVSGTVTNCQVKSETPANMGFGRAAQKLTRYFKMSPKTVDGAPVEGGQVNIPLTFNLAG